MALLERAPELERLRASFEAVVRGPAGACVVVAGEAGIGKTSLLRAFTSSLPGATRRLWCGCEALSTPRPLGPLIDLADRFPPSVEHALHGGAPYNTLFPNLVRSFAQAPGAQVLVVEDMHWADAGTTDFVRYLARRIHDLPLLLMLSHRDEGVDAAHPLQRLLGDLPSTSTLRLRLSPLSLDAVKSLAHAARREPEPIYAASRGNPFYVTELLASRDAQVPPSVRDTVLATLARLSAQARDLAFAVSLFPRAVAVSRLEAMAVLHPDNRSSVDECLRAGMLVAEGHALAFRHEIARDVVHDAMSSLARIHGHAAAFRSWGTQADPEDSAHQMHHAEAAGLVAEAATLAPTAARRAAVAGDHGEAARLYAMALGPGRSLDDGTRADLLEAMADELTLVNRHREAITAREEALRIHIDLGDRLRQGINQRWLARLHWFHAGGQGPASLQWARLAIDTLRSLPPSRELALAYSTMSHLCLVGEDMAGAHAWGLGAIELAESVDDTEAMAHALNNVACAILRQRDDALAWDRLSRSLELALRHGYMVEAARAYNNLFILNVVHHDFAAGMRWAEQGIAYCEAQGLDVFTVRIRIRRAFARIVMGDWDLAGIDLGDIALRYAPSPMEGATHAFVSSLLGLRRGEAGAEAALEAGVADMHRHRVEIWFITTAAARAEAAWLRGDLDAVEAASRAGLEQVIAVADGWRAGELAAWLRRAGRNLDLHALPELPPPYAHEIAGRWRQAALAWGELGCPYNQALALLGGDDEAQTTAIGIFDRLGAQPAAARVRQLLRDRGVRGVPRGPQPRTRDDPLNLTSRERQIFEMLREGASNAVIAARLHRSERTIEHHVSALLHKLGTRSRVELLARFPPPATTGP